MNVNMQKDAKEALKTHLYYNLFNRICRALQDVYKRRVGKNKGSTEHRGLVTVWSFWLESGF